ncbi:unnamed protein product [Rhizoctonia solani]|uniref:C2H2-type domain-containing protein n=1 Tax=Rhizoctonia solani TaxID=456999 RepID=A0A8H3C4R6_9AGAM|nr:unnamed protein product [Rhizoctonia solani]
MSGKRRHSASSSGEHGRNESPIGDRVESTFQNEKLPRTSEVTAPRSLVCSLPPTCAPPRHPTALGSLRELEEHYKKYHTHTCQEGNCRNEPGGAKIFPDARMLELHQTEYHDELARIKNEKGESIFACFLESCPKKFRTPKGRRLHLIDAHGYPKLFFFAVTKHGVGGLLARYGEGATLIRKQWKPRPENTSGAKDTGDSDEDSKSIPETDNDAGDQSVALFETKASISQSSSAATPQPREDLDELASSMKSLSLVPTSIRFGRGARRAGFIRRGPGRGGTGRFAEFKTVSRQRAAATMVKWLLRFKTGKSRSVGCHSSGVEVLPVEAHSQPGPAPIPARAFEAIPASAKNDTVISPSATSAHRPEGGQRSCTAINDLPEELFIRILLCDDETEKGPNLPLLASWTCSRWREVVLNTPTLWSTICLSVYGAGLPEVLLRSGGCGIHFILDPTSAESILFPRDVAGLLSILEPYYCGIKSLNLVLPDQDCVETALSQLCGAVPNLRSLELSLPYDPCSGMQVFAPALAPDIAASFGVVGCGSGEKLQVLKLQAVNFPWYDDAFSHLTTLHLASMCTEETMIVWEQFAETLMRNSSTLEELSLDQCDFCIEDEDEAVSFPVITLPRLKYLHLRLVDPDLIATFLSHASMPALETLELEFEPDDQCDVFRALFPSTSTCPEKEPAKSLSRVRSLAIQGGAYQADLFCEIIGRMPDLERLMLGGCIVTAAIIRTLSLPRVARKLTDMWLELCENYCAFDLQRLARARCGGVRVHEIGSAGRAPVVISKLEALSTSELVGDAASVKALQRTHLDDSLYSLDPDELQFFQANTSLTDPLTIEQHILGIQQRRSRNINWWLKVLRLKVTRYPIYAHVLEYGRAQPGAIFLEMACCFGNDARKAALDGYPVENIVATDLRRDFWDLGFKLFKDDHTTFPVPFLEGDVFSSQLLDLESPRSTERPHLADLKSLTELLGHVSIIHASAFFHLFSEGKFTQLTITT